MLFLCFSPTVSKSAYFGMTCLIIHIKLKIYINIGTTMWSLSQFCYTSPTCSDLIKSDVYLACFSNYTCCNIEHLLHRKSQANTGHLANFRQHTPTVETVSRPQRKQIPKLVTEKFITVKADRPIQITFPKALEMCPDLTPKSFKMPSHSAQNNVSEFYGQDKEVPLL